MNDVLAMRIREIASQAALHWFTGNQPKNQYFLGLMIEDAMKKAVELDRDFTRPSASPSDPPPPESPEPAP